MFSLHVILLEIILKKTWQETRDKKKQKIILNIVWTRKNINHYVTTPADNNDFEGINILIILELSIEIVENIDVELIAATSSDKQSRHDLPIAEEEKTRNTRQKISKKRKTSPECCMNWKKLNHHVTIPDYNNFESINS